MGLFSWRSVVSGKDIYSNYGGQGYDGIAMILPDNVVLLGHYDGYGRIEDVTTGNVYDIYTLSELYHQGKTIEDYASLTEEQIDKMRDPAIHRYYDKSIPTTESNIKLTLGSEIFKVKKAQMEYDDFYGSEPAEGQGHWESSYGRGNLKNLKHGQKKKVVSKNPFKKK